ncbi:MAG: AAA family ATPase [Nakamurella sp.]
MGARSTFVGRRRELAVLRDSWSLAVQGVRQAVFVGGEPGVGKSRIVTVLVTAVTMGEAAVLLGSCSAEMGAPYQPFVEPIAAITAAIEVGDVPVDWTDQQRERHLQSLRVVVGAAESAAATGTAGPPFSRQLYEACAAAVLAAARCRPLVLVLEDVHWAGESALELLRFLVTRTADSALIILATARTTAPDRSAQLISTVAQLYRLDGVRRLDLDGLSTEEIADYLGEVAGVSARSIRGSAAVLRDLTAGNPFLLREVVREMSVRGGISALQDVDLKSPESLRDTISHRLSGLPAEHRRTVETAAVIGDEFAVALLTEVARRSRPAPAALTYAGLEAAIAVGLIEPCRAQDAVFRFPHGLARQAVLELMTEYDRAARNAEVATVIEEHFPAADLRIQRLAHHYASALALGYADKATSYLVAAGEAAERGLAHDEAARLFERAAGIASEPTDRDGIRLRAARSYLRASRFQQARELDELIAGTATGEQRLWAAIGFEAASWRSGEPGERAVELLTSALADVHLGPTDPAYIRGVAALGRAQAFAADARSSAANGARAVELARATGDARLLAATLQIGLQLDVPPARFAEKFGRAQEISRLSEAIGDLRHLAPAAFHRAAISYARGDPVELAAAHDDLARAARATGQQFWVFQDCCVNFGLQLMHADFPAAARAIAEGRELARSFGHASATEGPAGLQNFMLRRETGGLEQIRGLISGQEDPAEHWSPGLLGLYCELGLREPTRRLLGFLLDHDLPRHRISTTWPAVLSFLIDAVGWLGDRAAAARLRPLAAEFAGLNLIGGEFLAVLGSADRQLGMLDSLLGQPSAAAHFEAALDMDRRMGAPLHIATTLARHVEHLQRSGSSASEVAAQRGAALAMCDRYGLVRVRRILADAQPPTGQRDQQVYGLTVRETEVLGLLSAGHSNRQIAEELFISENTAANHVRSILMKTGAANRTQAALFASQHGLLVQRDGATRQTPDGLSDQASPSIRPAGRAGPSR